MKHKILILMFAFVSVILAQSTNSLFYDADKLIDELRKLKAETYSPENFNKGLALYSKAKKMLKEGKSNEDIFPVIQDAESYFYKAKERAKINSDLFFYVSNLKSSSEKVCKNSKSAKPFINAGNNAFEEGISISEKGGNIKEIKEKISEAISNFSAAKIIAKKENVFSPVVKLRTEAKNLNAQLFSPNNFSKAEKYFNNALDFALKSNGEDFIKSILSAEKFYKKAVKNSLGFSSVNSDLTTAMQYAEKSQAKIYAPKIFSQAVDATKTAASEFEKGDKSAAENSSFIATKLFWDAEKKAIYYKYIGKPKAELDSLRQTGNLNGVKIPLRKAELYLMKAESLFEQNRYNKNIETLSQKSKKIIKRLKDISDLYSTRTTEFIDSLIINEIYPFEGKDVEEPVAYNDENLSNKFSGSDQDKKDSNIVNTDKEKKPEKVETETQPEIEKSNNVTKREITSPVEITANYFSRVYNKKDAEIVEKGKSHLRIRLLGLKLKPYQKKLTASQKNYLMKLYNVISHTKKVRKVIVEVYSDSKGGNALNKKLSKIRANVVKNTLIKYGLNKRIVLAKGIGNKNPIASNATLEGRNKNRRIEVILLF